MICECYYSDDVGLWKSDTFGISLVFVLFFLCADVDNTNARAKQKNDENKKRVFGEAKVLFSFVCYKDIDVIYILILCCSHIDGKNAWMWILLDMCINLQDLCYTWELVNRKLDVIKNLEALMELMRSSRGSMRADLFVALCCSSSIYMNFCGELCIYREVEYISMWELWRCILFFGKSLCWWCS